MPTKITEKLVLDCFFKDENLPSGVRIVSLKLEPGKAKLQSYELEKDGQSLKLGDWLPEQLQPSDVETWTAILARIFYRRDLRAKRAA